MTHCPVFIRLDTALHNHLFMAVYRWCSSKAPHTHGVYECSASYSIALYLQLERYSGKEAGRPVRGASVLTAMRELQIPLP
jgi:hypothetical protein